MEEEINSISATAKSPVPPDPPEDNTAIADILKNTMKLEDIKSEDARERLRSSNLDDLEKAFKYEINSESHDGTESAQDNIPFIPVAPQVTGFMSTAPQAPLPQAATNNFMSFANTPAPTPHINIPQTSSNTFDLPKKPLEQTFKQHEDDTIESNLEKIEEKEEEDVDIMINETFQEQKTSEQKEDKTNDMSLFDSIEKKEEEKIDAMTKTFIQREDQADEEAIQNKNQADEEAIQNKNQADEEEQKIPLRAGSSLFALSESEKQVDEEATGEIKPQRSVKFNLSTSTSINSEVKGDDEDFPFGGNFSQNRNSFESFGNDRGTNQQNTTYQQNSSPPSNNYYGGSIRMPTPVREKSKPVLVLNGYELTSPKRKTCLGFLLILGAAIGLTVSMINPPNIPRIADSNKPNYDPCEGGKISRSSDLLLEINSTIECENPTISPAPTKSHAPSANPANTNAPTNAPVKRNIWDIAYESVQRLIVESQVSSLESLPKKCHLPLCSAGVDENEEPTLQQKTVHYLLTQDQIFFAWVNNDELFEHTERILQRYILTLTAFSLNSSRWQSKQNWPIENGFVASVNECDWFGLTCGDRAAYINLKDFIDHTYLSKTQIGGREVETIPMVTKIVLRNNTIDGDLPQELFKLRHLEEIKLHHNKMSGTLPPTIGLLTNLKKLWLHDTKNLSGTIPSTIGKMNNLNSIWIGLNKFQGSIPKEIGQLKNLETIGFLGNLLTGSIPVEILELRKMKNLYLDINRLNGTLPEVGQLRELRDLRVDTNNLDGTLPSSLSELKKMRNLYAYKNNFRGELPNSLIVGWESLEKLELFSNEFSGTISSYLGQLPNLITIDLHDNNFNSTIPKDICAQSKLKKLDLGENNKIRGTIPDLSECISLETLDLSDNAMTGAIPPFLTESLNLKYLNLQGNNFKGLIPEGLCVDIPKCLT